MTESTKSVILRVLKNITGKNFNNIDENEDLKSQLNLDSIQIVELFASLEKEFNVELPLELMNARTGKDFIQLIENSLNT